MHRILGSGLLVTLMMALAGCSGGFEVHQTEPFRVQIDGEPQTMTVREGEEAQRVDIDVADCDCEEVMVDVEVRAVGDGPCTVHVVIEDADGNELASKDITIEGTNVSMDDDDNMTGNETEPPADDTSSGDTIIEQIVVNVKGKDNIVVVNEATSGDAEVNISANTSTGTSEQGNTTQDVNGTP